MSCSMDTGKKYFRISVILRHFDSQEKPTNFSDVIKMCYLYSLDTDRFSHGSWHLDTLSIPAQRDIGVEYAPMSGVCIHLHLFGELRQTACIYSPFSDFIISRSWICFKQARFPNWPQSRRANGKSHQSVKNPLNSNKVVIIKSMESTEKHTSYFTALYFLSRQWQMCRVILANFR